MSTCRTQASCANLRPDCYDTSGSSRLEDLREIGTAVAPGNGVVLRITPEERGTELFLKLEGRLRGGWVGELRLLWDSIRAEAKQSALLHTAVSPLPLNSVHAAAGSKRGLTLHFPFRIPARYRKLGARS